MGYRQHFRKNKLRACKILYSFSVNPVTNENRKTHARIGMYKKMNRVIENKKGGKLLYEKLRKQLILGSLILIISGCSISKVYDTQQEALKQGLKTTNNT
nr:hypothetical protein [Bacillus cereus group sp. N8]